MSLRHSRLAWWLGTLVLAVFAATALVHLPAVESRVVAWALGRVSEATGLTITVESASYDLFALRASARGIAVAVPGREPFLEIDGASAVVPPGALFGTFRFGVIDVDGPTVSIVQSADGSLNLPETNGSGTGGLPVEIEALLVRNGRALYRDNAGTTAQVSGLSLRLTGGAGTLAGALSAESVSVAAEGIEIPGAKLDGTLRYDGSSVLLDQLTYAASFSDGRLTAGGRFTTAPMRLDANVEWQDVRTLPLTESRAPIGVAARVSGRAEIGWSLSDALGGLTLSLENHARADRASAGALDVDGDLTFTLGTGKWRLHQRHRLAGAVESAGDLSGNFDDDAVTSSTVDGAMDLTASDLPRLARALARGGLDVPTWADEATGRLEARLRIGGTVGAPTLAGDATFRDGRLAGLSPLAAASTFSMELSAPSAQGTVDLDAPNVAGQRVGKVSARLAYADDRLRATNVIVAQPDGGRLSGSGDYRLNTGMYSVNLTLTGVSLRPLELNGDTWPISATVDGKLSSHGTVGRPEADGTLALSDVEWDGSALAPADLQLSLASRRAHIHLQVPDFAATLDGSIGIDAPYGYTATASVQDVDPATIVARVEDDWPAIVRNLTGTISAHASASGSAEELDQADVRVDLDAIDLSSGETRIAMAAPATLRYAAGRVMVNDLRLTTGGADIAVSGAIGVAAGTGTLDASVHGNLGEARPWLDLAGVPGDLRLTGAVTASVSASGSIDRPELTGRVQLADATVGWAEYPEATGVAIDATIGDGVIDAGRISAEWQGATANGRLTVPLGMLSDRLAQPTSTSAPVASFSGRVDDITERALEPFAGTEIGDRLTGAAGVEVDLRADRFDLADVRGTIVMDRFGMTAEGVQLAQARPTRFEIDGSTLRVADWSWRADGNAFDVSGTAALAEGAALDLNVAGRVDLRVLGAVLPDVGTAGLADVNLHVTGSPGSPLADGTVQIRNGELRLSDPQIAVTNAQGRMTLTGERVELADLQGAINGGRFTATGVLQHHEFTPTDGSLALKATGVTLNVPEGFRTQVDSDLTLAIGDRLRLTGTTTIQRGVYREPLSLAMGLVGAARERAAAIGAGSTGIAGANVDLDVALVSAEDLVIDNNYGRMDIGVDLRIVGTVAQPSVVGRATIREGGVVYLGGRVYQVERGTIDFSNPRAVVPDLDLVARTRISGYDVSLSISGTPDTVKGTLSSDPPLSQTDIVSLLVTGRTSEQAGGVTTQVAGGEVLAYLSGEALGFAAQAVGLDTLRLERGAAANEFNTDPSLIAGDTDPTTRLTVSKRFSQYAEVVLSQNLAQGGRFTWVVSYTPGHRVELRVLSLDDRSRDYELRHDVSFGGPAALRPSSPSAASVERVASVRFLGDPGFQESELLGQIRLKPGDRFDFYRWQSDRDRLRRFYLDRGYLEAHVSARHDETEGLDMTAVRLEYEIDRGLRSVLDVEGYDLSSDTRDELRQIWSNAIFDEALIADLGTAVRRALAADGYLRATVTVSRPDLSVEDEKHIRVAIDAGPRSTSREVAFSGNSSIPTSRLEALADSERVWLDPASLGQDVAALYRSEGYLAVSVKAGPVEFDGDRATLPVRIMEGRAFVVSSVEVEGVSLRSAGDVRDAFGFAPSVRYTDASVERGRKAVEADYARHGFNEATASVQTSVDSDAGTVGLTVTVDEGPQQILQTVDVSGESGINPGVVASALKLETGSPVNLDQWYTARRRLFDTGLFQRVDIDPQPIQGVEHPVGIEPVAARVSLLRQPPWRLRYGLQVTDAPAPASEQGRTFGIGATGDLQRRGLFGHAATLGLTARIDQDHRIGRSYLTLPTFFGRQVATSLYVSRSHQRIEQGSFGSIVADLTTVTAEQRFTPWHRLQLAYGYQFERNHTYAADADLSNPFTFNETSNEARLTATAVVDTRNDAFNATRGQFHSSNVELGVARLGSDVRFVKYAVQQFIFQPLGGGTVSASGFRLGAGRGFGEDLILTENFFAGGTNTVRGYVDDSLGSTYAGEPIGGAATIVLNQEIRFPIFRWIGGVGFIDAGNVFDHARDLSFRDLAVGGGAGLRFSTPVGLFRLDLGYPLPVNGRKPKLYFSLGQMF